MSWLAYADMQSQKQHLLTLQASSPQLSFAEQNRLHEKIWLKMEVLSMCPNVKTCIQTYVITVFNLTQWLLTGTPLSIVHLQTL